MIPATLSEPNLAPLVSFKSENEVTSTAQIIILVTVTGGSLNALYRHFILKTHPFIAGTS